MFGDLADLWERAAADGTPVHAIVGDDPVEFAETFAQAYTGRQWIDKERARLVAAIEDAEREGTGMTTGAASFTALSLNSVAKSSSCRSAWLVGTCE